MEEIHLRPHLISQSKTLIVVITTKE